MDVDTLVQCSTCYSYGAVWLEQVWLSEQLVFSYCYQMKNIMQ